MLVSFLLSCFLEFFSTFITRENMRLILALTTVAGVPIAVANEVIETTLLVTYQDVYTCFLFRKFL